MKRLWWIVASFSAVGVIVILGLVFGPKSPVLPETRRQLTSTLLLPKASDISTKSNTVKYDKSTKQLSFNAEYADTTLIVSQQPTPESFTDIPQAYDKVVQGMNNYLSFDVNAGTAHITKPQNVNGQQVGVINTKGTLMFVRASRNLSDDQWRYFFSRLQVQD